MTPVPISLDADIIRWIESQTGSAVVGTNRIPGGGSREGWLIDVAGSDGSTVPLFLRYSPVALPAASAFHRLATEAEVIRGLAPTDVPVAAVLAVHPAREAVLMERVEGDTWFYRINDPDEQVRVAQDFIRSLAAQHRIDPRTLGIDRLGPVRSAREHALERIADIRRRGADLDGSMDPVLRVSVDWLARNVPDYDGPVVLVQGDTGPGNFLYRDGRVTAVLDWELCHYGDPMDDIAWLSLRTVQDTFTHLPDRLREYAALSGHPIDVERVWYYRVFAEATMATLYPPHSRAERAETGQSDLGNLLIYGQLHRRLWLEALNVVLGLNLEIPTMPEPAELAEWHVRYSQVLTSLQTIAPRIADPLAAQWTRGVARAVKHLQELDASGREYADLERVQIGELLGVEVRSLEAGRALLAEANRAGQVSDDRYVGYLWNRVMRDDHLMRTASGSLHRRTWPPLLP
jgi:aminoglycoside phosphotransferase (APT) family kinase protein